MKKGQLMESLELGPAEAAAYLAVLGSNGMRASNIACRIGVPRPKVYEILGRLVERGLIIEVKEGVARFYPVRPDLALDQVRSDARAAWERRDQEFADLSAQLLDLFEHRGQERRGYEVVRIWSGDELFVRKEALLASTQHDFVCMFAPPIAMQKGEQIRQATMRLVVRGVQVRILWDRRLVDDPAVRATWTNIRSALQFRYIDRVPFRLDIFDNERALIAEPDGILRDFDEYRFQEYTQPFVIRLFRNQFEELWNEALPIPLPLPRGWQPVASTDATEGEDEQAPGQIA